MPDPITVEVVCPECEGLSVAEWQLCFGCGVLTTDGQQRNRGTHTRTLVPGSLDEALHRLGLATERWDNSKSMISPESRAALGEMSQHLAEVRRLREAGNV